MAMTERTRTSPRGRETLFAHLIASSPAMREVLVTAERAAQTDANVYIYGENGTGKELVARAIHYCGARRARPLVTLDCTAIPEGLMVLHHCDVPACVRPDHLYLGTAADNWRDTLARSRRPPTYNNGETNAAAKLTSRDVADIRSRLTAGDSVRSIARTYPVGRTMSQHIKQGRAWANDPSATVAS